MIEYIEFWLAKTFADIMVAGVLVALGVACILIGHFYSIMVKKFKGGKNERRR